MKALKHSHAITSAGLAVLGASALLVSSPVVALAEVTPFVQPQARVASSSAGGGWVVTDEWGDGLQRYWVWGDGTVASDELIEVGDGTWAYARPEGYVVRGKWVDPGTGNVYIADNDGRLASTGWVVSDAYGDGLQRYWVDAKLHACVPGRSDEGWAHYTTEAGYVLRGTLETKHGLMLANNDGLLADAVASGHLDSDGWFFGDLGSGDQLYCFSEVDGQLYARSGFFSARRSGATSVFYASPSAGYVVRGKSVTSAGVLLADSDGRLAENDHSKGWVVTDAYDGVLQRYYLVESGGHLYAKTGLFSASLAGATSDFYGDRSEGCVVRGATRQNPVFVDGKGYTSDNEGRLTLIPAYDGSRKRDTYVATVTWGGDTDYIGTLAAAADRIGSDTNYFMTFDNELCRVIVFQRSSNGDWKAIKLWNCMGARRTFSAANSSLYGWSGVYKITDHQICAWDDSYFGKGLNDWASCFIEYYDSYNATGHSRYIEGRGWENCVSFHATGDYLTGNNNTGCCGLLYENAKWVYDNVPLYTTVIEFDYSDGTYF